MLELTVLAVIASIILVVFLWDAHDSLRYYRDQLRRLQDRENELRDRYENKLNELHADIEDLKVELETVCKLNDQAAEHKSQQLQMLATLEIISKDCAVSFDADELKAYDTIDSAKPDGGYWTKRWLAWTLVSADSSKTEEPVGHPEEEEQDGKIQEEVAQKCSNCENCKYSPCCSKSCINEVAEVKPEDSYDDTID